MKTKKFFIESLGSKICCVVDMADKPLPCNPIVLMLHGSTNSKTEAPEYPKIASELAKNGINAFRFDFFGSGDSEGTYREKTMVIMDQNIKDVLDYIEKELKITAIGVLGRSLSAAQSLYIHDDRIKVRVVHSAASHLFDDLKGLYPQEVNEMYEKNLDEALIVSDPRIVKGPYSYSRVIIEEFKEVPNRIHKNLASISHISVFQGDNDPETTVEEAMEIYNTVQKPKEIHVFSDQGHRYEGTPKELVDLTVSWFVRQFKNYGKS
jgi:uncharacterized protein